MKSRTVISRMLFANFFIPICLLQIAFSMRPMSPQNVSALIITTASKIDVCCATLGSQIDQLTNIVETNFAATFTSIASISSGSCDLSGTNSLISVTIEQGFTTQSKLDECCFNIVSKIDTIQVDNSCDLSGTYTLLNTSIAQEFTTQSKLDLCCATVNSKIDLLSGIVVADFAATFTVLDNIRQEETTIESKVDALTNSVKADFAGTFTAIAAISGGGGSCDLSGTYTALNALGLCNEIPLTIPGSGVTISNPGTYCVTNDAVVTTTAISITASNVVLNLNGHTIQSSGTGILLSSIQNVIIHNGTISGASQGIRVNSAITALHVSDLDIMSCNNGIISPVRVTDTSFKRINFYNNFFRPLNLQGFVEGVVVEDCFTSFSNSYLVSATASSNNDITFNRCISNNCPVNSSFEVGNTKVVFDSCQAINTVGNGFTIFAGGQAVFRNCAVIGAGFGYSIEGYAIMENCVADSCGIGFNLTPGNGSVITNCTASNNTGGAGFQISSGNTILIQNSKAHNNIIGFDLSGAGTGCSVVNCVAQNNSSNGFLGDPSLGSIFYLNSAVNNGTNYADLSPSSAPTVLLTSTSRLYGDNLASSLP